MCVVAHLQQRFISFNHQKKIFLAAGGGVSEWVSESRSVVSDSLWPHGLHSPWNSPGQNTEVGSLSLVQGIFLTQGSNPGFPHCRQILYQLSHKGSPRILEWVAYLPNPGIDPGSPALQADSLPNELWGKPRGVGVGGGWIHFQNMIQRLRILSSVALLFSSLAVTWRKGKMVRRDKTPS